MRTLTPRRLALTLAAALAAPACGNDEKSPEAQYAEQAVGVRSGSQTTKTAEKTRDVIVEEEKKVVDAKTGEVLSDKKTETPVTITEQTEVKKNVSVDVKTDKGGSK